MSRKDEFAYAPPPPPVTVRRVYSLPPELVKRIHAYGYAYGHQSEASAVRELLTAALDAIESLSPDKES